MKRYDTYKDSGVQWLGEIPGHWGCVRMKYLVSFINGYAFDSKNFLNEGEVAVYRISDIQNDCISTDNCVYVSHDDKFSDFEIQDNDLLIAMSGATTGKTGLVSGQRGYINQRVGIIRSNYIHYIKYGLRMLMFLDYIVLLAEGSAQPNISANGICQYRLPLPPLSEQRSIVSFLDDKCGKIDEWVTKKQKEVEHLQELKQRVIADAVTRGLNPHVKMKATNIPWIKEIPEHWEALRAKHMFNKEQRPVEEGDEIVTCFRDGEVTLRKNRRTTGFTEATDFSHYQHICKGDLVIHQMDAFAGSAGVSDSDGMGTPVLSVCTPKSNNILNEYYAHIVRLMGKNGFILSLYRGIRERSSDFRFDTFANLWLPVPPIEEQKQIVAHIKDKISKIDKLIANINKEIEGIKEYKQRLISDVVTGQIKVN